MTDNFTLMRLNLKEINLLNTNLTFPTLLDLVLMPSSPKVINEFVKTLSATMRRKSMRVESEKREN